jgi:type II secretion system protein L
MRMTILRVLVDAAPLRGHALSWALFDAAGTCVRSGRDLPDAWPDADRIEAVLAASQVRIASVALPPLTPSRVASAAAFAVDDQLAGPAEALHLAASPQQPDGCVRVVIAARSLVAALRDRSAPLARVSRAIAEPELALPTREWRWCAAVRRGDGFIRRGDGSAFPVSTVAASEALPPEVALALSHARRDGKPPPAVRVEFEAADTELARWQEQSGIPFVRGPAWRWTAAPAAAFAGAIELLQGDFALAGPPAAGATRRLFMPAMALAGAALALHVVATIGEWGALRLDLWRQAREWSALAETAGLSPEAASTPASAQTALAKRYAELRHARGMPAPDDALPLLARAAPALRVLPAGGVKSASYADGHWTLDLLRAGAAVTGELDAKMKDAGVPALIAVSAAGVRIRLGAL